MYMQSFLVEMHIDQTQLLNSCTFCYQFMKCAHDNFLKEYLFPDIGLGSFIETSSQAVTLPTVILLFFWGYMKSSLTIAVLLVLLLLLARFKINSTWLIMGGVIIGLLNALMG